MPKKAAPPRTAPQDNPQTKARKRMRQHPARGFGGNHFPQAFIFDLDGTLLDTLADLADSVNEVLAEDGLPLHDSAAIKSFVGRGMTNLVTRALPADLSDETNLKKYLARVRQAYGRNWANKTRPYGGIMDMLRKLFEKGLPLAVLSNKPDDFTRLTVDHFFGDLYFKAIFGARETVPIKPDPAGALEIAEMFSLAPESMVFVGDSAIDIRTAVAAKMFAVGVSWGFRSREALLASGAELIVDTPDEILELLE